MSPFGQSRANACSKEANLGRCWLDSGQHLASIWPTSALKSPDITRIRLNLGRISARKATFGATFGTTSQFAGLAGLAGRREQLFGNFRVLSLPPSASPRPSASQSCSTMGRATADPTRPTSHGEALELGALGASGDSRSRLRVVLVARLQLERPACISTRPGVEVPSRFDGWDGMGSEPGLKKWPLRQIPCQRTGCLRSPTPDRARLQLTEIPAVSTPLDRHPGESTSATT